MTEKDENYKTFFLKLYPEPFLLLTTENKTQMYDFLTYNLFTFLQEANSYQHLNQQNSRELFSLFIGSFKGPM